MKIITYAEDTSKRDVSGSRRMVQTHLAPVFAKRHISSRAQLAAEATRRQAR
jgi:DNA-binding CsgD family transcriptional regulator